MPGLRRAIAAVGNPRETVMVYLLHFERAYRHARHYVGYTEDLEARLAAHRAGHGARLLEVIDEAGIGWELARLWPDGDRDLERRIKRAGHTPRLCPTCNPGGWMRRRLEGIAEHEWRRLYEGRFDD